MINQIEFNPYCVDQDILDACFENGILVQAYSPLGSDNLRNKQKNSNILENEILIQIAKKRGGTVAQVSISWALSKGRVSTILK